MHASEGFEPGHGCETTGMPDSNSVWAIDLDGVIWLGEQPIPGSASAVAQIRATGDRVLFVTNNSFSPVREVEQKLERQGIPAAGDVITSAMAAASLVSAGERVMVLGGPGIFEALAARGVDALDAGNYESGEIPGVDVVMVGFHRSFNYERLRVGATAIRRGARLVATNDDATYPTAGGPIPGGGSILAAVVTGSGVEPIVTGKPCRPMADIVIARAGGVPAWMIGDRPDTDGEFALALGCPFGLVLSGISTASDLASIDPRPNRVTDDLATMVGEVLATR